MVGRETSSKRVRSDAGPDPLYIRSDGESLAQMLGATGNILELLPIATCVFDLDGRIVQYNRRSLEMWGRSPQPGETHEQFTARSKFFDADGHRMQQTKISEVLQTGRSVRDEEVQVERPDGSRAVIMINIDPLFDAEGRRWGAISCIQDITEQKLAIEALDRSRQELRQQQERWNATYEHAAIGIVEIDAEGRFLRVNEAICSITGQTREELLGWRLYARTHPQDREVDEDLYRRQVAGDIGFYTLEKRFVRKDGRIIWIAVRSSTVRDADGNFLYGVRVVQDITERKEAEERQKLMVDELNHRVKNTLSTVQSLASQTARGADTPEAFRQAFEGRLIALSQAHDQLTRRHWKSADLRDIISGAVAPHVAHSQDQLSIAGEAVTVAPRVALTLALVVHELATNAAKYGALSVADGRIGVRWSVSRRPSQAPSLSIEWRESAGPVVREPARQGFGTRFIVGSAATELRGGARIDFDPAGLRCTIEFSIGEAAVANAAEAG